MTYNTIWQQNMSSYSRDLAIQFSSINIIWFWWKQTLLHKDILSTSQPKTKPFKEKSGRNADVKCWEKQVSTGHSDSGRSNLWHAVVYLLSINKTRSRVAFTIWLWCFHLNVLEKRLQSQKRWTLGSSSKCQQLQLMNHFIRLCPLYWNLENLLVLGHHLKLSPNPWRPPQFSTKFRRNELMQQCECLFLWMQKIDHLKGIKTF